MDEVTEPRAESPVAASGRVGEGLLLLCLVGAPWLWGGAPDTVRYAVAAVTLAASALALLPLALAGLWPRRTAWALAVPLVAVIQALSGASLAPILTLEAGLMAASAGSVWLAVDARAGHDVTRWGRALAASIVAVSLAQALFAAVQWSQNPRSLFGRVSDFQTMPFGSYVNHNNFAGLLLLGVPIALGLGLGDIRRSGRLTPLGLALLAVATALAIAIAASGSRGGLLALVAALLVFVLRAPVRSGLATRSVLLGLALLLLAIAAFSVSGAVRERMTDFGGGSVAYRVEMARASVAALATRPWWGGGLGAFGDFVTPQKRGFGDVRSDRAEGDLLEIPAEIGVLGLLVLGLFAREVVRAASVADRSRSARWLRAGAFTSCCAMLAHAAFDFGFRLPANALAFAVALGLATASPDAVHVRRRGSRLVPALFLALACVAAYRGVGARSSESALARATPETRLQALDDALRLHPYLDEARRQRALAWMNLAYSRGGYDATRLERAERDFEIVLRHRPAWGLAWADRGWNAYFRGDVAAARDHFARAVALDPTHVGIGVSRAQFLVWSQALHEAVEEVRRLRRAEPAWSRSAARSLVASWTNDPALLASIP